MTRTVNMIRGQAYQTDTSDSEQLERIIAFRAALDEMPEEFQEAMDELRGILAAHILTNSRSVNTPQTADAYACAVLGAMVWNGWMRLK